MDNSHLFKKSDDRLLLNARDAAAMLSVCERTLWNLERAGALSCVRAGRIVRFDPADLRAWIESHKKRRLPAAT